MEPNQNQAHHYAPLANNDGLGQEKLPPAPTGQNSQPQPQVQNPYGNTQPNYNMGQPQPGFQQPIYNQQPGYGAPQFPPGQYMPPQPNMYQQPPPNYYAPPPGVIHTHEQHIVEVQAHRKNSSPKNHHHHHHQPNNLHHGVIYTEAHLPMVVRCYHCGYDGLTRAEVIDGAAVWVTCVVCCLLGCFLCAPCTFCMDGLKDVQHYCGSCHALVAVKKPCH